MTLLARSVALLGLGMMSLGLVPSGSRDRPIDRSLLGLLYGAEADRCCELFVSCEPLHSTEPCFLQEDGCEDYDFYNGGSRVCSLVFTGSNCDQNYPWDDCIIAFDCFVDPVSGECETGVVLYTIRNPTYCTASPACPD